MKVAGRWRYVYRAIDQHGQIVDVYVSSRRDLRAARQFFTTAFTAHGEPEEIVTDKAPALARAISELVPGAFHNTDQYANNRVECDHGRLKSRLRPMRGLKHNRTASTIIHGHALMQNIRRGHYELAIDTVHIVASRPRLPNSLARSNREDPRSPMPRGPIRPNATVPNGLINEYRQAA